MRDFLLFFYRVIMQIHGLFILAIAITFATRVTAAREAGFNPDVHIILAGISGLVGLCFIIQRGLPQFVFYPAMGPRMVGALLSHAVFFLLFTAFLSASYLIMSEPRSEYAQKTGTVLVRLSHLMSIGTFMFAVVLGLTRVPMKPRYQSY